MRNRLCGTATLALLGTAWCTPVRGQGVPGDAPSVQTCSAAAAALAGGSRIEREWSVLSSCGAIGVTALSSALRAARQDQDLEYLEALSRTVAGIKGPELLLASAEVATDAAASTPARGTALLALVAQYDNGIQPSLKIPFGTVVTGDATRCPLTAAGTAGYASRATLQADSSARVASALDVVRKSASAPAGLRTLAQCARDMLREPIPIRVAPQSIKLTYICGNRYRVRNTSDEWVGVSFDVYQTPERGELTVGPGAEVFFTTLLNGTVRLHYGGALIQTKANGRTTCPQ